VTGAVWNLSRHSAGMMVRFKTDAAIIHAKWKSYAISRYRAGDTIRTDRFRYTKYSRPNGQALGQMLYDHKTDPNENTNIADDSAQAKRAGKLAKLLQTNIGKPNPQEQKTQ
jgi:arylsulfatase A-like enzyme